MADFWVIDTTCTVLPTSSLELDGSEFYYNRAVVPADSKEAAIALLTANLEEEGILIREVVGALTYEDGDWSNDFYHLDRAYHIAKQENEVCTATFISSDVYDFKYKGL
ncbi:hypothetical protein EUZ85_22715 [Hahella sp. KA22]|uniref:hypothetical protein n=1 Tax=Hahella sp. KA22 TaxID=1628392 RepID=UPI000FDDC0AB|nr:hypothetical protein [Hahella sp. KA22]AZZ93381.1 hypothetical protein ENC22_20135 [Hahella sp. KA22]QAY56756.1 hypothetical protein EUZ85_22715 [Hahella sp. KA22]